MPRVLNVANHQTFGHSCSQVTRCVTPTNSKVFSLGEEVLVANDPFVPHSYCGVDGTHIGVLIPAIPNVTVGGKPIGSELTFTSCGDLVLCVDVGKVFVNDPIAARRTIGGGAADPIEEVTLGGYPKAFYPQGDILGKYSRSSRDRFGYYRFSFIESFFRQAPKPNNAYTELNITDSEGKTRQVRNYPGPPITPQSGSTEPLPAYARLLQEPIKVVFRMLNKISLFVPTSFSSTKTIFSRNIPNTLQIDEDTGIVSNLQSLNPTLFPESSTGSTLKLPYPKIKLYYQPGFEFYGNRYFPDPSDERNVTSVDYKVSRVGEGFSF